MKRPLIINQLDFESERIILVSDQPTAQRRVRPWTYSVIAYFVIRVWFKWYKSKSVIRVNEVKTYGAFYGGFFSTIVATDDIFPNIEITDLRSRKLITGQLINPSNRIGPGKPRGIRYLMSCEGLSHSSAEHWLNLHHRDGDGKPHQCSALEGVWVWRCKCECKGGTSMTSVLGDSFFADSEEWGQLRPNKVK